MNNNRWIVRPDGKNTQGEALFIVRRKAEGGFQQYPKSYTDCGRALRRANSLNGVECATVNNVTEESTV